MGRRPGIDERHGGRGPVTRAFTWLETVLEEEADRWFLWLPVLFGIGIGIYFSFRTEPGTPTVAEPVSADPKDPALVALECCPACRNARVRGRQTQDRARRRTGS